MVHQRKYGRLQHLARGLLEERTILLVIKSFQRSVFDSMNVVEAKFNYVLSFLIVINSQWVRNCHRCRVFFNGYICWILRFSECEGLPRLAQVTGFDTKVGARSIDSSASATRYICERVSLEANEITLAIVESINRIQKGEFNSSIFSTMSQIRSTDVTHQSLSSSQSPWH